MLNLYKVYNKFGEFYVVAINYGEAQSIVETHLHKKYEDYCNYRNTEKIELIASDTLIIDNITANNILANNITNKK